MQWSKTLLLVALAGAANPGVASPEYGMLDQDASALKASFNAATGKVRIVAYVAPTCGGCLHGVDQIQKHVLPAIDAQDLEVFVVWVKKNGAREEHVEEVTRLTTDSRATQYWDEHGVVVDALDELLGIRDRACAGAFLVYGRDAEWTEALPPHPAYWSDAHSAQFEDHGPPFDAGTFADAVRHELP